MEWEFWTSSNGGCGNGCDRQADFKQQMRETAQSLEKVAASGMCCMIPRVKPFTPSLLPFIFPTQSISCGLPHILYL